MIRSKTKTILTDKIIIAMAFIILSSTYAYSIPRIECEETKKESNSEKPQGKESTENFTIIINGQPLTGPYSLPEQRGDRNYLPIASIARALGDKLKIDLSSRTIEVQRQTGVVADFNAQLNQIRENGVVILGVSNTLDIIFTPNLDELMLPVEIVGPLFDISITVDKDARTVKITRGQVQANTIRSGKARRKLDLFHLDYAYNLNSSFSSFNQNLALNSSGRFGDDRFDLTTSFSGGTGQLPLAFQRGTFNYSRPNGTQLVAGDFGTGTDLRLLSLAVRGFLIQQPLGNNQLTAFAGRAISGQLSLEPSSLLKAESSGFDTNVVGAYVKFGSGINGLLHSAGQFSAGFLHFNNSNRRGDVVIGNYSNSSKRNSFQAEAGLGNFSGTQQKGEAVQGTGLAVDLSDSFKLRDNLTLQGRFAHIGPNYLSPESSGFITPMNLVAGGISFRPIRSISASLNGQSTNKLDNSGQKNSSFSATLNISPRDSGLSIFLIHNQLKDSERGKSSSSLLSITKKFEQWRLLGNLSRIQILGVTGINALVGASVRLNNASNIDFSQSFGNRGSLSGSVDYMTSSLFNERISFGAGFGYNRSEGKLSTNQRMIAVVKMPYDQTMQLNFSHSRNGYQIQVQLRGPFLFNHRGREVANLSIEDINTIGSLNGRVYQDINLNGLYDPGIDKPQSNVQLQVDGKYFVETDHEGIYKIDNLLFGDHEALLNLLTVRADLTILDNSQKNFKLDPKRDLLVDFRLIRTGRITGMVWQDANGDGIFDKDEKPVEDVRVLASNGRDTQTYNDGSYLIGDLPPGEYTVLVDEKTLPLNHRSTNSSHKVLVQSGNETGGVNFPVSIPVKVKKFQNDSSSKKPAETAVPESIKPSIPAEKVEPPIRVSEPKTITTAKPSVVVEKPSPEKSVKDKKVKTDELSRMVEPLHVNTTVVGNYTIQVSSSQNEADSRSLTDRLQSAGFHQAYMVRADLGVKGIWFRVRVGRYQSATEANRSAVELKAKRFDCFVTQYN
jgi:cell division septation protein DedD